MKVLQSNDNFKINDGQMTIQVTVVRLPVGSRRKPLHAGLYFESDNMRKNKQSIIQINNTLDVMCMARAVEVAECNAEKEESESWKKNWKNIRQSDRPMQTREAMKLLDRAKILILSLVVLRNTRSSICTCSQVLDQSPFSLS